MRLTQSLLKSNSGSAVLLSLVTSAGLLLFSTTIAKNIMDTNKKLSQAKPKISANILARNLASIIDNDDAWDNTLEHPDNANTKTCKLSIGSYFGTNGGSIGDYKTVVSPLDGCNNIYGGADSLSIMDPENNFFYNPADPKNGFNNDLSPCAIDGQITSCKFTLEVSHEFICSSNTGSDCINPNILITGLIGFDDDEGNPQSVDFMYVK